jgi:ubiquinol-cytochrome c reductase cytochrome c subunit
VRAPPAPRLERRLPRRLRVAIAIGLGAAAVALAVAATDPAGADTSATGRPAAAAATKPDGTRSPLVAQGRELYLQGCSDCHGFDARGVDGVAPDLHGAGALAADFYLRTGRMPLDDPEDQPKRSDPIYDDGEIAALVAYVGSLGGPAVPTVDTAGANVSRGRELFTENCAGCHQVVAQGGILPGAVAPDLQVSSALDVAEAVDVGPYIMPTFKSLTADEVADIASYVTYTRDPEDKGGWGIGHIGPIPEGMVAWLLAGAALLIAIRLIGERTTR